MTGFPKWLGTPNRRIAALALLVYALDQGTKWLVVRSVPFGDERVVIDGFFKFVHWGNTGAAFSLFTGNNAVLAVIGILALLVLIFARRHFESNRRLGQLGFGLLFGGILGNVTDRLLPCRQHVIDFLRFYHVRDDGTETGFPAFNIADSGICAGVALIFWLTWRSEQTKPGKPEFPADKANR